MKRWKRIGLRFAALLVSAWMFLLSTGCSSYRDLDKLLLVTSILMDYDADEDEVILYIEAFKPVRSSEKESNSEERVVYKVQDKTVAKALQNLYTMTSSYVTYTHNKVLMVSKTMSEHGFKKYFDLFDRGQDFISRALLCIYDADPEDFVDIAVPEEKMTGIYLYDLINNEESISAQGVRLDISQFMNQRYIGDKTNVMPVISTNDDAGSDKKFCVDGLALIKEYQLIGTLDGFHSMYYNLTVGNKALDTLTLDNPQDEDSKCLLEIFKNKVKTEIELKDDVISIYKKIEVNAYILETQGDLNIDVDLVEELEEKAAKRIEHYAMGIFNEYKERGIDIFNLTEEFDRKFPKEQMENIMPLCRMEIEVDVTIRESPTVQNFH